MPGKVREYCRQTGQTVPDSKGSVLRVVTESLALKYRQVVESLEKLTGRTFEQLHVGGGGIQNELLVQSTANALGFPVVAGPVEATSCGNIITQMVATGEIANITEGRKIVADSMNLKTYTPNNQDVWDNAYNRFLQL